MKTNELIQKVWKLKSELRDLQDQKKEEYEAGINSQCAPLLKQIQTIKDNLYSMLTVKYEKRIEELLNIITVAENERDELLIQQAAIKWYSPGTKVYNWDYPPYSRNSPLRKTDQSGIVVIYDGTQPLSEVRRYSPDKGDLLVIYNKKDGTQGLKYEIISSYRGELKYNAKYWCAESDTPETNPYTIEKNKKEAVENETTT